MQTLAYSDGTLPPRPHYRWLVLAVPIGIVLIMLSFSDFSVLIRWWQQPEGSHAWMIPIISLLIMWRRWPRFVAAVGPGAFSGTWLVLLGVSIYILDSVGNLYQLQIPALILITLGIIASSVGWNAARFALAPLAFCLFASPPPDTFYVYLSLQLQLLSSAIGTNLLHQIGVSAFLDGNIIDLGIYRLHVAEACSGLRYLFPLLALAFLCTWMYPASLFLKIIVFASTIPITIMTNSFRIALTGVLVHHFSIERAEGFMHLFEGWLIFFTALSMLFALMYVLQRLRSTGPISTMLIDVDRIDGKYVSSGQPSSGERVPWRVTTALMITIVVLATSVAVYAWLQSKEPVIVDRRPFAAYPQQLEQWQGTAASISANLEETLAASDYLLADYIKVGEEEDIVNLWIAYFDHNSRKGVGHTPKGCLPGAGWEFDRLDRVQSSFQNFDGERFVLMRGIARKSGRRILFYYWLENGEAQYVDNRVFGLVNAYKSLLNKPTDAGLVRVVTPLRTGETEIEAERRVLDFLSVAYPKLEPHF